jgi:enterochelin esterase-like enzyme
MSQTFDSIGLAESEANVRPFNSDQEQVNPLLISLAVRRYLSPLVSIIVDQDSPMNRLHEMHLFTAATVRQLAEQFVYE